MCYSVGLFSVVSTTRHLWLFATQLQNTSFLPIYQKGLRCMVGSEFLRKGAEEQVRRV